MSIADRINLAIAITAGISVLVTLIYTVVTFRILKANQAVVAAMRDERLAQNRPYIRITVFIRTGTQLIYLSVKNTGRAPAWKLRLTIERDFYTLGARRSDGNLASFAAFAQVIECFPPDAEMQFLLGTGPSIFGADVDRSRVPLEFDIVANYGFEGSSVAERTTVDLKPYMSVAIPHHPVVEELERMRNVLSEIRTSIGKLEG